MPGNKPLKTRLSQMLLAFSVLPCCLLSVYLSYTSWRASLNDHLKEGFALLTAIQTETQSLETQVESVVRSFAVDPSVMTMLDPSSGSAERVIQQSSHVLREITIAKSALTAYNANVVLIYLDENKLEHWPSVLSAQRYGEDNGLFAFLHSDKIDMWSGPYELLPEAVRKLSEYGSWGRQYQYQRKVFSTTGKALGIIRYGIDLQTVLQPMLQTDSADSLAILNGESVLLSTHADMQPPSEDAFADMSRITQGHMLWQRLRMDDGNLTAWLCTDLSVLFVNFFRQELPTVLLMAFALIGMFALSSRLLNTMLRRLQQTAAAVNRISETNYHIALPKVEGDEVGSLVKAYNKLITRLDHQNTVLLEEERSKREMQTLALQYQLNPHFLFNSLQWLQMELESEEGDTELSRAVDRLGIILHYNMSGFATATLAQEKEQMYAYVDFMSAIKRQTIHLDTCWDSALDEVRILRFTFQPILENAIRHGRLPGEPLHLRVTALKASDHLEIHIQNDGKPIATDVLSALRTRLDCPDATFPGGVGLRNLSKRLTLHYGKHCAVTLTSEKGLTDFSLLVPLEGE